MTELEQLIDGMLEQGIKDIVVTPEYRRRLFELDPEQKYLYCVGNREDGHRLMLKMPDGDDARITVRVEK